MLNQLRKLLTWINIDIKADGSIHFINGPYTFKRFFFCPATKLLKGMLQAFVIQQVAASHFLRRRCSQLCVEFVFLRFFLGVQTFVKQATEVLVAFFFRDAIFGSRGLWQPEH